MLSKAQIGQGADRLDFACPMISAQTSDRLDHCHCAGGAIRIMRQTRSGPKELRALAEELDARQEAKCQRREIDLVHDPSAQPDERQKPDRSGETSQRLSRPPFQPRDRF